MRLHKRLVWMIVILLSAFTAALVQAQIPDGAEGKSYYVAFPTQITVDGTFSDWDSLPRQTVKTGPIVPTSALSPSSLKFAAAADYDNLYLLLEVTDPLIVANQHDEQYWFEDSVEVYINATGQRALTSYVPGVAQLTFPAASIGLPIDETIIVGTNSEQVGAKAVVVETDIGYSIEAMIPLRSSVWNFFPVQDKRLGFQIQLNGASELDRDMKLSWSKADQNDESYLNPSVFGELIFWKVGNAPAPTPAFDQSMLTPFEAPTSVPSTPAPEVAAISVPSLTVQPMVFGPEQKGFTVEGPTIYDPNGNVFVAKGVNISGYNWTWPRKSVDDVELIDQCWNFNLVRVNNWLFKGRVQWDQYDNNNDLDEIVRTFTSRGIVVVFEGHDFIGGYYQGEDLNALVDWYTDLATRYRDNPYVWFDIMNEPGGRRGIDVVQWVDMHGRVIEAIRKTGNNNIIIVEGAFGGQDNNRDQPGDPVTDSAILQYNREILTYNGNTFSNIVFSIHTWDLWNQGDEKMADYFDRVHEQGLAMIVGEYGIRSDKDTQAAAESTFNTTIPRGVGRVVWHWDGGDYNDLTEANGVTGAGGGWMINDCINPTNLSWMGQKVWEDNHSAE